MRRTNPKIRIHCHDRWSYVEGGSGKAGNPLLVYSQQFLQGRKRKLSVYLRDTEHSRRSVETNKIVHGPKEPNAPGRCTIGLQSLKNGLPVMQNHGCGVHHDRPVRFYPRVPPPVFTGVIHVEHVIRKLFSKAKFRIPWFWFRFFCSDNLYLHSCFPLPVPRLAP